MFIPNEVVLLVKNLGLTQSNNVIQVEQVGGGGFL